MFKCTYQNFVTHEVASCVCEKPQPVYKKFDHFKRRAKRYGEGNVEITFGTSNYPNTTQCLFLFNHVLDEV